MAHARFALGQLEVQLTQLLAQLYVLLVVELIPIAFSFVHYIIAAPDYSTNRLNYSQLSTTKLQPVGNRFQEEWISDFGASRKPRVVIDLGGD